MPKSRTSRKTSAPGAPSSDCSTDESMSFEPQPKKSKKQQSESDHGQLPESNIIQIERMLSTSINSTSRCGKIASIRLQNFMCHDNLFIEFGPNINFLVGCNGSGKSAVLTAITLGLAGTARSTNRATAIQKLIKNGETSATIEIALHNDGMRPFNFDQYGPRLIVERQIRMSSSSYSLKNSRGETVSKKLDDIRRFLMYFSIYADNPVFVLNQDAARQFLKDLEPSANYELIIKAGCLDRCSEFMAQALKKRIQLNNAMKVVKDKISMIQNDCRVEESKLQMLDNENTVQIKLMKAEAQLAWLRVKQAENELQLATETIKSLEQRKTKYNQKTAEKDSIRQSLTNKVSHFEDGKKIAHEKYAEQERKVKEVGRRIASSKQQIVTVNLDMENLKRRLKEAEHSFAGCQKQLENYNAETAQRKKTLEEHKSTLEENKTKMTHNDEVIKNSRDEMGKITISINSLNEKIDQEQHQRSGFERLINVCAEEISALHRNKHAEESVYGSEAMAIVARINAVFTGIEKDKKPRGPIGKYITVPNQKDRDLVEHLLGNSLHSFIVGTDKDYKVLRSIIERESRGPRKPPIIKSSYTCKVYDVSRFKVKAPSRTKVFMDIFTCEDPVVMNYLIDAHRVESLLISESRDIAEALTSNRENVPPNMSRVIVPKYGLEYHPEPHYAMYSMRIREARYLQVNLEDRFNQLQNEITKQKQNKDRTIQTLNEFKKNVKELSVNLQHIKLRCDECVKENDDMRRKNWVISNYDYHELPAHEVLQKHCDDLKRKITVLNEELEALMQQKRDLNESAARTETEQAHEQRELKLFQNTITEIEKQSVEAQSQIRNLDGYFEKNSRDLKATLGLLKAEYEKKELLKKKLEEAIASAKQKCDDGEGLETVEEDIIVDQISRYKSQMKQFKACKYSREDVTEKLSKLRNDLDVWKVKHNTADSTITTLRSNYRRYSSLYSRVRERCFIMVDFYLGTALDVRHFQGKLSSNHKDKLSVLEVTPPSGNRTHNTRTLSGGERSFVTISLLKALWSISDHPFHFLDEYDVFTDEVNRTHITNMLIAEGERFLYKQYCFLTPQDTKVSANSLVVVHKLEPPTRN